MSNNFIPNVYPVSYLQGKTLYAMIAMLPNMLIKDLDTGTFSTDAVFTANSDLDPVLPLTESVNMPGSYSLDLGQMPVGSYQIIVYSQAGGSPAPTTDLIIDSTLFKTGINTGILLTN